MDDHPPYLTTTEAAHYLRLPNARALIVHRSRHKGPPGIRFGNRLLFTKEGLDAYLQARQEATAHETQA